MTLHYDDPYAKNVGREIHGNRYLGQLRRKVNDALEQYRDLGGTIIEIRARAMLPSVKAELKTAVALLDRGKADKVSGKEVNLVALKTRVNHLREVASNMRDILSPPKRDSLTTHTYYATIPTRVLDFDGSDHKARQFGGTIVSRNARVDVPSDQADRDQHFNPKRESHTSDTTDEITYLQARLAWVRTRIARCNTAGSVEQMLIAESPTQKPEPPKQQYIVCGYGYESPESPARVNGWNVDPKVRK